MTVSNLLFGIAGALVVTGEYPRHAIRSTFVVVPRRGMVVAAKSIATAIGVFVLALLGTAGATLASRPVLDRSDVDLAVDGTLARIVLGAALSAVAWALLGQALGWILRSTIGATMSLLALMWLLPAFAVLLPDAAAAMVVPRLPSQAADSLVTVTAVTGQLSASGAAVTTTAYVALGLVLASWWVGRRDA
jgi:ABC-2 type transport system permease protein